MSGARDADNVIAVVGRRVAIGRAVGLAEPGDIVLVAGKGHERTQQFDGYSIEFDDRVVARELLGQAGVTT